MSTTILTAVRTWLDADGLLDDYAVRFNRWTDEIEGGSGEFVLLRMSSGSGENDALVISPDVRLIIVASPEKVIEAQDRIWQISDYMRQPGAPEGVIKFAVLANPMGPMYLENGRGVFELNVRVFV